MVRSSRFRSSSDSCDNQTSLKQFFITLHLEPEGPPNVLEPEQRYGNFQRKYVRIYVHNSGHAIADRCTAQLRILRTGDLKQLCWDGIDVLSDLSNPRQIGIEHNEILHIAFSDSRSTSNYAYISTMLSIANPSIIRMGDAYNHDSLDAELTVITAGGAYCEARLRIFPNINFRDISMEIISQQSGHLKLKRAQSLWNKIWK
jgi:hypothetical protein